MNLLCRIFGHRPRVIRARYDAAEAWSPLRSNLQSTVQDVNRDLSRASRRELMRKARHWYQNSGLVRGVIERIVSFTVGTGIVPVAASSDAAWNEMANKAWQGWVPYADLTGRDNLYKLQEIAARSMFVDGEVFTLLTYGDSGRPRLQLVESHRIADQSTTATDNHDGITFDAVGRPSSYRICRTDDVAGPAISRPSDSVVHHLFRERPQQEKGVTILSAALLTSHDLHDIIALEKIAVKDAASKTDIIKTASGELDPEDVAIAGGIETTDANGVTATKFYREVFGPEAKVLKHGDEFTPYVPSRPGPAWNGFVEFLVNLICISTGFPPSVLVNFKMGGADSRRDVATAQRLIERFQADLCHQWQRVWEYVIQDEIDRGMLPPPPADWRNVSWQTPRAITLDYGREAMQDREDVKAALMTRREYWGRYGLNDVEQDSRIIAEAAKRKADIAAAGMSVEEFTTLIRLDPVKAATTEPQPKTTP